MSLRERLIALADDKAEAPGSYADLCFVALAAARLALEDAERSVYAMTDVLRPPGQPGSYSRGDHNGLCAAARTVRALRDGIA